MAWWQASGPEPADRRGSDIPLLKRWTLLAFLNLNSFRLYFTPFFFLYIVVILKHFSLCFVFDICYRLTSGDLYLVGEVGGCLFVFLRGGQG